jgi:ABC-type multidrug transport system ATPase subunit
LSRPQARAPRSDDLLTGEENLRFFGEMSTAVGASSDQRVKWCLDFVGLTDRKDDRAGGIPAA